MVLFIFPIIFDKIVVPKISRIAYFSDKYLQDIYEYKINEHEILVSSEISHAVINKNTIFKIKQDNTSVYLYISAYRAVIIKDHFFDNAETFEELANFIRKHYA